MSLQKYGKSEINSGTSLIKIVKWQIIDDFFAKFAHKYRRNPTKQRTYVAENNSN